MRWSQLFFCCLLITLKVAGQGCVHTTLSKSLLFKTNVKRIKQGDYVRDSCIIRITVSYKQATKADITVTFSTVELSKGDYANCNWTRSYSTGKKAKSNGTIVLYEDYGDLVVGDFNFDGLEDFAAKRESPNGGTQYNYYVQKNGLFVLDKFLTEKVIYAPNRLNHSNHTLQIFGHVGAGWGETTFQLNKVNNTWKVISSRFLRSLPPGYPEPN